MYLSILNDADELLKRSAAVMKKIDEQTEKLYICCQVCDIIIADAQKTLNNNNAAKGDGYMNNFVIE